MNMMAQNWQSWSVYGRSSSTSIMNLDYNDGYKRYVTTRTSGCPSCQNSYASFRDPQPDVIASVNKLMVYIGAFAGSLPNHEKQGDMDPGLAWETEITGYQSGTAPQFHTDYWYFFAAALIEVVCVAFIAPTYWGWWRIGRPVSFSPLEMAKAFESPMLSDCYSNSNGRTLAKYATDEPVRYGLVPGDPSGTTTKIAFAESNSVTPPQQGTRVDF